MTLYYAGVGRRTTSFESLKTATIFAKEMYKLGYTLRSGGASGADSAFERGANNKTKIFLPSSANKKAVEFASQFHPAWHRCSAFTKNAHARNAMILMGENLDDPVEFTAYIKSDLEQEVTDGGTGVTLKMAKHFGITTICINTKTFDSNAFLLDFVKKHNIKVS